MLDRNVLSSSRTEKIKHHMDSMEHMVELHLFRTSKKHSENHDRKLEVQLYSPGNHQNI